MALETHTWTALPFMYGYDRDTFFSCECESKLIYDTLQFRKKKKKRHWIRRLWVGFLGERKSFLSELEIAQHTFYMRSLMSNLQRGGSPASGGKEKINEQIFRHFSQGFKKNQRKRELSNGQHRWSITTAGTTQRAEMKRHTEPKGAGSLLCVSICTANAG